MFRNRSVDLINQETEWGMAVSEAKGQKGAFHKALIVLGFILGILGVMAAIPIVAGYLLFPISTGVWREVVIVVGAIVAALVFKKIATSGPRNALQIDYEAGEVRLGSTTVHGVFARHRVCPFTRIEEVDVMYNADDTITLKLLMESETATISLSNAEQETVEGIVAKIDAAREAARLAPVRSRVQSAVMGFEAGIREVGQRVRSRVSRPAF